VPIGAMPLSGHGFAAMTTSADGSLIYLGPTGCPLRVRRGDSADPVARSFAPATLARPHFVWSTRARFDKSSTN